MTDKKLTDEEIIETLERCSKCGGCFGCAMAYMHSANCIRILETECLDLINRQKAEIESLKSANDEKFRQWDMLAEKKKQHYADSYNEAKDILKAGPIGFICRVRWEMMYIAFLKIRFVSQMFLPFI